MQISNDSVLEVVSDSICPWCYIGKRRLELALKLLGDAAPRVAWKPFQLNPDMPLEGLDRRAYRTRKFGSWERSQGLDGQVRAAGADVGIDFAFEKMLRTPNTFASHKLIHCAAIAGREDAAVEGVFRAYFVEGRDIGNPEVLVEIGAAAGLPKADVIRALSDPALADAVQREEESSRRFVANGVPTFVLSGNPLTSGAQPAELLASLIKEHAPLPAGTVCDVDGECK